MNAKATVCLLCLFVLVTTFGEKRAVAGPPPCQAQENAYYVAVEAFNLTPNYATAMAVAEAQANYQACMDSEPIG